MGTNRAEKIAQSRGGFIGLKSARAMQGIERGTCELAFNIHFFYSKLKRPCRAGGSRVASVARTLEVLCDHCLTKPGEEVSFLTLGWNFRVFPKFERTS